MISFKKKSTKKVLRIIIVFLLIVTVFSFFLTKFIYDASFPRHNGGDKAVAEPLTDMVSQRRSVDFLSGKNRLKGYYYEAPQAQALVVVAPGYAADDDEFLWHIHSFLEQGWSVFSFDPTGHYDSEGSSSVGYSQQLLDLDAALDFIESRGCFGCEALMLFGHSRGGYAVCGVLEEHPEVTAVVSISGINKAMDAVIEPATRYMGALAYGNYPMLWFYQSILFGTDVLNVEAVHAINQADVPVLIVHGSTDDTVSVDKTAIIAHRDEIKSEKVEYYLCDQPGQSGHTDLLFDRDGTENDVLMTKIHEFYQRSINMRG